jgi:glycosyltransferase involved in cell wall biosynthesis
MLQFAEYLKTKGVDVSLIAPRTGPLHQSYQELNIPVSIQSQFQFHGNEQSIIQRYGHPADPNSNYKPNAKNCDASCKRICSEFDILVANTNEAMLFVHDMFHCVQKILWWVHESNWEDYQVHYRYQGELLKAVQGSVFVTQRSKDNYKKLMLQNSVVIGNSFDTSTINRAVGLRAMYRKQLGLGTRDVLVMQIGTMVSHKQQVRTVQAIRQAINEQNSDQSRNTKINLIMVGNTRVNPQYENEVYAQISPLGGVSVANNVAVHDKTSDTAKYFEAADLYILPSTLESFGLTLLEASMYGLPIITSGADGIGGVFAADEMTVLNPDWIDVPKTTSFADAISTYARWPNDISRYSMVRKAQTRVQKLYSTERKMLELTSELARMHQHK